MLKEKIQAPTARIWYCEWIARKVEGGVWYLEREEGAW